MPETTVTTPSYTTPWDTIRETMQTTIETTTDVVNCLGALECVFQRI